MNNSFEIGGLHHLALVCKDMGRTVEFYTNKLGMTLNKGFDLDAGYGQHFFFDMGNGQELAFFWFNDAETAKPGVASAANLVASGNGTITSAHGSMNHVAFSVSKDKIDGYREELVSRGIDCSKVVNHDDVISGDAKRTSDMPNDKTWLRSFYFFDPDGIMLEFCATLSEGVPIADLPVNEKGIKANGQPITGAA
ncbi:MAG: catechol 2,3-dioxygenase-like lactoylglutathione lyase family enzyme [Candidatus Azotimanducaceae bacterium]|jgi:catechol 2,3-dioxygenase-like lactoylglutathione lyase family enzyme